MASDVMRVRAAPARDTRAGGGVRHAERAEGGGRVDREAAEVPGVRVPLHPGCTTPAGARCAIWRCRGVGRRWCGCGAGSCATTARRAISRTIPSSRDG